MKKKRKNTSAKLQRLMAKKHKKPTGPSDIAAQRAMIRRFESFNKEFKKAKSEGICIDPDLGYLNWGRKGSPSWGIRKRFGENINCLREKRLKKLWTLIDKPV